MNCQPGTSSVRFVAQISLVLFSAGLTPLCFPPFNWWPLILLSVPALLWATTDTTSRRACYLGLLHGMVAYGTTLYWFFNIFRNGAIPLFAILAIFTGLFCCLYNAISQRLTKPGWCVLFGAVLWTSVEFYRCELFFLRFPWVTPGTALGPTYLSPLVGVYGTTFLIVLMGAALLHRRTLAIGVILTLGIASVGVFRPGRIESSEGALTVAVVQNESGVLISYADLTDEAKRDRPDLIVWPEHALSYDVRKKPRDFHRLKEIAADMEAVMVVGTQTATGSGRRDWYNTALVLDQNGVLGEYYKSRPVHFFNDGIAGDNLMPVETPLGVFGTPICFDCDYTEVIRRMVASGAEYLVVPSFDAKSWSANQHLQHSLLFRIRAAENGRWLACAASSGVSQIIDPNGQVHASLPPMVTGTVSSRINRRTHLTFFTRFGWLFPWITCLLSVAGIFVAGFRWAKRRVFGSHKPDLSAR